MESVTDNQKSVPTHFETVSSSSDQDTLFKELGQGITGLQSFAATVASHTACGEWADYRQDYYYCVKSKSISCQHLLKL